MLIHFICLMCIQQIIMYIILMRILIQCVNGVARSGLNSGVYGYYALILAPILKLIGGGINGQPCQHFHIWQLPM